MILSGEMMLRHLQWNEAADLVIRGLEGAIAARTVTYDFHRQVRAAQQRTAHHALQTSSPRRTDGAGGREGQAAQVL